MTNTAEKQPSDIATTLASLKHNERRDGIVTLALAGAALVLGGASGGAALGLYALSSGAVISTSIIGLFSGALSIEYSKAYARNAFERSGFERSVKDDKIIRPKGHYTAGTLTKDLAANKSKKNKSALTFTGCVVGAAASVAAVAVMPFTLISALLLAGTFFAGVKAKEQIKNFTNAAVDDVLLAQEQDQRVVDDAAKKAAAAVVTVTPALGTGENLTTAFKKPFVSVKPSPTSYDFSQLPRRGSLK